MSSSEQFSPEQLSSEQLQQLYRYSFSLCAHKDDAYDLLQSALEKLLKRSRDGEYNLSYCRITIRNLYIDQCRHRSIVAFQPLEDELPADINEHSLEELVIQQKTLEEIWPLFDTTDREILFLWAVLGHTAQEIAEETDTARGTVLSRIHRIRQKVTKYGQAVGLAENKEGSGL